jgi:regulator of protease activity HflC (stomatin/prohibitin superfamily)
MMYVALLVLVVLLGLSAANTRVLREYQRGVLFRLGRLRPLAGPGLVFLIPFVDRMERVDLRTVTLTIPPQEVITRDNVPARVNAVAYFRVTDPARAITEVEAYPVATSQIAQTTLRSVLGHAELDDLLSERDQLNDSLRRIIDEQTEPWGIKVTTVEIKDVEIPEAMQKAMARQAEAERERRAKIINAEGEFQAAQKIYEAAEILSGNPAALQLRYLQTLLELGGEKSTIVFPLPIDLVKPFLGARRQPSGAPAPPEPDLSTFGDALRRLLVGSGLVSTSNHTAGDRKDAGVGVDVPDEGDLEPDDDHGQPR